MDRLNRIREAGSADVLKKTPAVVVEAAEGEEAAGEDQAEEDGDEAAGGDGSSKASSRPASKTPTPRISAQLSTPSLKGPAGDAASAHSDDQEDEDGVRTPVANAPGPDDKAAKSGGCCVIL